MLVEIHHLEAIELFGYGLNLVLLARLLELDTFSIPEVYVNPVTQSPSHLTLTIGCSFLGLVCSRRLPWRYHWPARQWLGCVGLTYLQY